MVIRINPKLPLLWRTPDSLQIGFENPVLKLDNIDPKQEKLLEVLSSGTSKSGLELFRKENKITEQQLEEWLTELSPVLRQETAKSLPKLSLIGEPKLIELLEQQLRFIPQPENQSIELAILAYNYFCFSKFSQQYLSLDQVHLPVVFTESSVTIGPVIKPGKTPCLHCIELELINQTPELATLVVQLIETKAVTPNHYLLAAATAEIIRLSGCDSANNEAITITLTGNRKSTSRKFSENCYCRQKFLSEIWTIDENSVLN